LSMEEKRLADLFKRVSFGNGNMISPGYNSLSFRIDNFPEGLPTDLHFTIAYIADRKEINLHVTRNFKGMDPKDKPKNDILVTTLDGLDTAAYGMGIQLIQAVLVPITFVNAGKQSKYGRKQAARLMDLSKPEQWSNYSEGDFLAEARKHFIQTKGGRGKFEMKPSFNRGIKQWSKRGVDRDQFRQAMKPLRSFEPGAPKLLYLNAANYQGPVIMMEGRLWAIRQDLSLTDFFAAILGKEITALLTAKIFEAIAIVANAKTFSEIRHLNKPIRLFEEKAKAS
jgi:hypothetical protein